MLLRGFLQPRMISCHPLFVSRSLHTAPRGFTSAPYRSLTTARRPHIVPSWPLFRFGKVSTSHLDSPAKVFSRPRYSRGMFSFCLFSLPLTSTAWFSSGAWSVLRSYLPDHFQPAWTPTVICQFSPGLSKPLRQPRFENWEPPFSSLLTSNRLFFSFASRTDRQLSPLSVSVQ